MTPTMPAQQRSWEEAQGPAGLIGIDNVSKAFRKGGLTTLALSGVTMSAGRGEFLSVVGPSGCGKSSILNLVAGLSAPTSGQVRYDGKVVQGANTRVGYMTQRDTLLPWHGVAANIELPLRLQGADQAARRRQVKEWIDLVGLSGFEDHYPAELSGGMRRRVALARTLIYQPETVLMDEPFGALDAQLRLVLQEELLGIWARMKQTIVFVTHDLEEAIALSDRVIVMSARPGQVRLSQPIGLPRPRNVVQLRRTPEFGLLFEQLWETLSRELSAPAAGP